MPVLVVVPPEDADGVDGVVDGVVGGVVDGVVDGEVDGVVDGEGSVPAIGVVELAGPEVDVWYANSRTSADTVLRNQKVSRFIGSPLEGLEVESLRRQTGGEAGGADQFGPLLGAADVDVAIGDIRDPPQQRLQIVDVAGSVAEP